MFLAILSLITALSISAVAIYYSVAGLVAIFAAAAIPIIIMGGVLEIGKLVTAVWLHKYWDRATWWLKTYLSAAVIILMFITSMGIFGFLSKAHIEQTSAAGEGVAQIEQIETEIARQQAVIARAEQIVETTQTSGTGADQNIQAQIDREQQRIDTAYDRVQPAIEATRAQLESDKQFYLDQLPGIDEKLAQFETLSRIDTNDEEQVKQLQAFVGARPDGAYGGGTARAVKAFKESLEAERTDIFAKVEELKAKSQEEIARLRSRAESEIDDSNKLITRLRSQLGTSTGEDIDAIIDEQNARIKAANTELDTLTEEKFQLEAQYRALEAEVGPIKYIAEFIYGEQADKNLLEEAVRWVIIVIIIVFDPLAVLLLIASQYTFGYAREGKDNGENTTDTGLEEEPPEKPDGSLNGGNTITEEQDSGGIQGEHTESADNDSHGSGSGANTRSEEPVPEEQTINSEQVEKVKINTTSEQEEALQLLAEQTQEWDNATKKETQGLVEDLNADWYEENERIDIIGQNGNDGLHYDEVDQLSEEDPVSKEEQILELAKPYLDVETNDNSIPVEVKQWNNWIEAAEKEILKEQREAELKEQEEDHSWQQAKQKWKEEHPELTLKEFKNKYVLGLIDELPWKDYVHHEAKKYITKENGEQVIKETKPTFTEVVYPDSYTQNAEQSEDTLWSRIKRNNEQN